MTGLGWAEREHRAAREKEEMDWLKWQSSPHHLWLEAIAVESVLYINEEMGFKELLIHCS